MQQESTNLEKLQPRYTNGDNNVLKAISDDYVYGYVKRGRLETALMNRRSLSTIWNKIMIVCLNIMNSLTSSPQASIQHKFALPLSRRDY